MILDASRRVTLHPIAPWFLLRLLAAARPVDPTWIAGLYDGGATRRFGSYGRPRL